MFSRLMRLFRRRRDDDDKKDKSKKQARAEPVEDKPKATLIKAPSGTTTKFPDFEITKRLDSGAFGVVYKCQGRGQFEGRQVAVKMYDFSLLMHSYKDSSYYADLAALQAGLDHPHVVCFLGHFTMSRGEYSWLQARPPSILGYSGLVMELLDGPSLLSVFAKRPYPEGFTWPEVRLIMSQIGSALDYLHRHHSMIHNDLKLDNIMLSGPSNQPWHLKLVDFGLSESLSANEFAIYDSGRGLSPRLDFWAEGREFSSMLLNRVSHVPPRDEVAYKALLGMCRFEMTFGQMLDALDRSFS